MVQILISCCRLTQCTHLYIQDYACLHNTEQNFIFAHSMLTLEIIFKFQIVDLLELQVLHAGLHYKYSVCRSCTSLYCST